MQAAGWISTCRLNALHGGYAKVISGDILMADKSQVGKPIFVQFQEFMNRRDKEYLQAFIETTIPTLLSFAYLIVIIFIFTVIWGNDPPSLPGLVAGIGIFLINSITGIIIIIRKRTPGSFFTVRRGKSAVIIGIIWVFLCFLCSLAILGSTG